MLTERSDAALLEINNDESVLVYWCNSVQMWGLMGYSVLPIGYSIRVEWFC